MISDAVSVAEELTHILEDILAEERQFRIRRQTMQANGQRLEEKHRFLVDKLGAQGDHQRLRRVHEAMFKVHRKIEREHELAVQRCHHIAKQLRAGLYSDVEISFEISRVRDLFADIKGEHNRIESERRKILAEHNAIVMSLSTDVRD